MIQRLSRAILLLAVVTFAANSSSRAATAAAPAADTRFPAETVAFLSVGDPQDLRDRFSKTQLGQLVDDASMQEFARHLRDEAINQVGDLENRLGVTIDDLFDAAGGELAAGMIHRRDTPAVLVVTLDVTGKQAEADAMLAKIEKRFAERGGKRSETQVAGVTVIQHDLPATEATATEPARKARTAAYFQSGDLLVALDNETQADRVVADIVNGAASPLTGVNAYQQLMKKTQGEVGSDPINLRWFVNPFKFKDARETMDMPEFLADRSDWMTILGNNGFKAIEAVGGVVGLAVDAERDLVHRTALYAPGNPSGGVAAGQRFEGAMRIVDAPNRNDLAIEKWAPRSAASYRTISLNIQGVFDNLAPLFDDMAGYVDAFKTTLESFEKDPYGPKINIREKIIAHLGSRVTMMTDYNLPVVPDCQRYLFAVEATNEAALRTSIDKLMESDGAIARELRGVAYWEVVPESEEDAEVVGLEDPLFDDPLFDDGIDGEIDNAQEAPEPDARHSAVCVHNKQLIVTSDVEFLEQILFGPGPNETLAGSEDFQYGMAILDKSAPGPRSSWSFTRNDESVRPTYELVRAGRMPESQTFFGRLLNQALTTAEDEENGIVRKQRLDGSKMPTFELARRYFGPTVRSLRTDDDGWVIVGVLLNKSAQ